MTPNEHLALALEHLAVAVSGLREQLHEQVYRDVPDGRFTRILHRSRKLAIAEHHLLGLQSLAIPAPVVDPPPAAGPVPAQPDITVLDGVARAGLPGSVA